MKQSGYTHAISYYKKVDGLGWMYNDFKTTGNALKLHLSSLYKQQTQGTVRLIDTIKLKVA